MVLSQKRPLHIYIKKTVSEDHEWEGMGRVGEGREGKGRKGKEREGKRRKEKEREGKGREEKERGGKIRKENYLSALLAFCSPSAAIT